VRALAREENRLRLEVASLKNPARIERLARQQLQLHNPRPHQVRIVR
jgi:cell division protein FtsL